MMVRDARHTLGYVGQLYRTIRVGMTGTEVPQCEVDNNSDMEHRIGIVASMGDIF
jgi:hypothetical protein